MSLSSGGPCEITVPRAGAWLAPRVFIHGRPSTLTPCPSIVQLVIVMPTPPCSHARYALCPALSPPALYNRYSAGGVCTAGNSHFQTIPYQKGLGGLSTGGSLSSTASAFAGVSSQARIIGCTFLRRPLSRFRPAFRRLALLRIADY